MLVFPLTRLIKSKDRIMELRNGQRIYLRNIFAADFYVAMEIFDRDDYGLRSLKLPAGAVILDIGANIGAFSLLASHLFPEARIFSFEPEKNNFGVLSKNVELNDSGKITIYNEAVSDKDGVAVLNVDPADSASHSLEGASASGQAIATVSLKAILSRESLTVIDLLKMDIEGSEYEVLFQSGEALVRVNNLVLEVHDHSRFSPAELLEFLKQSGFEIACAPSRGNVYRAHRLSLAD